MIDLNEQKTILQIINDLIERNYDFTLILITLLFLLIYFYLM